MTKANVISTTKRVLFLLFSVIMLSIMPIAAAEAPVEIREQEITIPTYKVNPPNPNPIFYDGRVYQGAQGRVYPYPLMDELTDEKVDKSYRVLYLENKYVKISVLPELGGRIFSAVDKTNGYNFFYHQHVIKPALIGMIGAWISGGVEWDLPHHHRPSAFLPVNYTVTQGPDGSKTLWIGEIERRHRMQWIVGLTLHPDKSYVETTVKLINRTPLANSFLYFANVAVHTNENYQVIFPPRTQYVTYHSKVQFSRWPIAHGIYNGADFRKGVDVSWWKNHPRSTSMFAWNFWDDFLAGYDHGRQAGTLHVADHNTVPGKKFFTWGRDDRGRMWDHLLTDDDGPYLELMVGAWSDNQPDYSWVHPYAVKTIKQYWYPFRDIGGVKKANVDAAVNLDVKSGIATIGFCVTAARPAATVRLSAGARTLFETKTSIDPAHPFVKEVPLPEGVEPRELKASLSDGGLELISYTPVVLDKEPMPKPVTPPLAPAQIKTNEELYLTGLRLGQFYNPVMAPYPYYEEALRRDPGDYRVNTQLGVLYLKRGMFETAEKHLRAAVKRATRNYTRPKDGEAYYYLGVALTAQGRFAEASDCFHRAAWTYAWRSPSYQALAENASLGGDYAKALENVQRSLETNTKNLPALELRVALLRKLGKLKEAYRAASSIRRLDPLNFFAANEAYLVMSETGRADQARKVLAWLTKSMREDPQNYLELAAGYARAGMWDEAMAVISRGLEIYLDKSKAYPMLYYFQGYFAGRNGNAEAALKWYRLAAAAPPDYCFPYRLEAINVLRDAMKRNPRDARAPYYLGNLLFDNQPEAALEAWERSCTLDPGFSLVHRNLGLAYARVNGDLKTAIASMERSIELKKDPRVLFELDELREQAGVPAETRLAMLEANQSVVEQRDDAFSREISLLVELGRYDRALALLSGHHFRKWEGVASVYSAFVNAHLFRGHQEFQAKRYQAALKDYHAVLEMPANLEAAKSYRDGTYAKPYYYIGRVWKALGDSAKATEFFEKSVAEADEAFTVRRPDLETSASILYYKGASLRELGRRGEASQVFATLIRDGAEALKTGGAVAMYAKFGGKERKNTRLARAHYLIGLGYLGQNKQARARKEFRTTLSLDPHHPEARQHLIKETAPSSPPARNSTNRQIVGQGH